MTRRYYGYGSSWQPPAPRRPVKPEPEPRWAARGTPPAAAGTARDRPTVGGPCHGQPEPGRQSDPGAPSDGGSVRAGPPGPAFT
jgi:hypothetical protein